VIIAMSTARQRAPFANAFVLAVALCAALACTTAIGASDDVGKKKADEACAACHGPEGNKPITPETPRLGGQQYDYLVQALTDYRKGARDNAVMSAMAKPLTEKEIRDLAGYFSKQQGLTTKR
jgi:cytochrome c553